MAVSVEIESADPASGDIRTITLIKKGADTMDASYVTSSDPHDVKTFGLSDVRANPDKRKISVTYGSFPFSITATGTIILDPPSVSADAGLFGRHDFPLKADDCTRIVDFLKRADFPRLT